LNTQQVSLVQSSFAQVAPIADTAAALFYQRLFELDPALKPLFKGDIREQGKKLMQMIAAAVNSLNNVDTLLPAVQALGKRHHAYGVTDKDYDTVGSALLWTLESGLGDAFTPPVRQAWTETYVLLSGAMKEAAVNA
jgi:hemoglobin-like flavoprotein